jgi:hypothetical protein
MCNFERKDWLPSHAYHASNAEVLSTHGWMEIDAYGVSDIPPIRLWKYHLTNHTFVFQSINAPHSHWEYGVHLQYFLTGPRDRLLELACKIPRMINRTFSQDKTPFLECRSTTTKFWRVFSIGVLLRRCLTPECRLASASLAGLADELSLHNASSEGKVPDLYAYWGSSSK